MHLAAAARMLQRPPVLTAAGETALKQTDRPYYLVLHCCSVAYFKPPPQKQTHLKLKKEHNAISSKKIRIKRLLSLYRCQIWQVDRHAWYAHGDAWYTRGENVRGGNSHQVHFCSSLYGRKILKLVRLQHNGDILQRSSPAASNPIQTHTKTMYSNNNSGRAGRHGQTGLAAPAGVRCLGSGAPSTTYIQTKGPYWVA